MTEPNELQGLGRTDAVQPDQVSRTQQTDRGGGAAFQALLEKLQVQADRLEASSRELDDPVALAGAVDVARASLDDASSLSDQLLEAFRSSQLQTGDEGEAA